MASAPRWGSARGRASRTSAISTTPGCARSSRADPMGKTTPIRWLDEPEKQNYPAARSYLSLLYGDTRAAKYVAALRSAKMTTFKAKDIFRASGLSLLGVSNSHVDRDRAKIASATALS